MLCLTYPCCGILTNFLSIIGMLQKDYFIVPSNLLYQKFLLTICLFLDVKGLTKWLSLPFGNMDKNSIEKRKNTLENFMKVSKRCILVHV